MTRIYLTILPLLLSFTAISQTYPANYFRNPLDIQMQLVANFGEIRPNHWHMGLDIRTHHKVNLPVHAAADGYIARISVEPEGFGQAVYINHPNGTTTVYGHLNSFRADVASFIKQQQYAKESWAIDLQFSPDQFPVRKGDVIALSGSTGSSEGPHVHFEIRDTKTGKNLNPLLFHFPVPDAVPPVLLRLAVFDGNRSIYEQTPAIYSIKHSHNHYVLTQNSIITGASTISFAIGAVDHLSHSANPIGIYSAKVIIDGNRVSEFELNKISYDDTRYINAQIDYFTKAKYKQNVQHISPLPGDHSGIYLTSHEGIADINDGKPHHVKIEVRDAYQNVSSIDFSIQFDASKKKSFVDERNAQLIPNQVNVFEKPEFELYTTDMSIYDTINSVHYAVQSNPEPNAISPLIESVDYQIPVHDAITVRIKTNTSFKRTDHLIIKNQYGAKWTVAKGEWKNGWISARFRQFGNFQALIDNEPPTINAPGAGEEIDLTGRQRIVFIPKDNYNSIRKFHAELDGQWMCFTNDKGKTWIYTFDNHFPKGVHDLKVTIEDEAGNITVRTWKVKR